MSVQQVQVHNLPSQPTTFIGREPEIAEIVDLLQDEHCRLLTLLGAGGMGKTRLGIETIQRLTSDDFEHGVYYVPLAPLASADNIVTTVIGVLGIMIGDDGTPQQELVKFLKGRNLLLVMDNFEHVLEGADLVADILGNTQDVKILATSREPLNLRMERLWHVRGMDVPDGVIDDINDYSGVKLFVDRARWVRRDFDEDAHMESIVQICKLVGGMPLGIELSASWLKTLSCEQIIKQIERGIDFLSTRARDVPERHRSIRAVFDYSWNLLTASEQAVFPRLSVFRGGFTLEAAEAVADVDLITLSGLVEKSMVRRNETGRYDLHELLRQYADGKLQIAAEVERTKSSHMYYFSDFMVERTIDIKGRRQIEGLRETEADFYNIRKSWHYAVEMMDFDVLDQMMEGIALYGDMHARYQDSELLIRLALKHLDFDCNPLVINRLKVRFIQIWALYYYWDVPDSISLMLEENLEVALGLDDKQTVMLCHFCKGELYRSTGYWWYAEHPFLIEQYRKARDIAYEIGELYYVGRSVRAMTRGFTPEQLQTDPEVMQMIQEGLQLVRDIGDYANLAHFLFSQFILARSLGNLDVADKVIKEALAIFESLGDRKSIGILHYRIGTEVSRSGDFVRAIELLHIAEELLLASAYLGIIGEVYGELSLAYLMSGDMQTAEYYCEQTLPDNVDAYQFSRSFYYMYIGDGEGVKQSAYAYIDSRHDYPYGPYYEGLLASYAMAHDQHYETAVEVLSFVFSFPGHQHGWMENWDRVIKLQDDLRCQLGIDGYEAAWERGKDLNIVTIKRDFIAHCSGKVLPTENTQSLLETLSKRELEVLALVAEGLTNPQIADKLYLATGTVKVHTRNIYGKLSVSNRTEAAKKARELGLI